MTQRFQLPKYWKIAFMPRGGTVLQWQMLSGVINKAQKTITIQISHFSTYAVMGKVLPPPPVTAVVVPPTTNAIDQAVSLISVSETNPSSFIASGDHQCIYCNSIITPDVPQQTPTPNVLPVNSQPNSFFFRVNLSGNCRRLSINNLVGYLDCEAQSTMVLRMSSRYLVKDGRLNKNR